MLRGDRLKVRAYKFEVASGTAATAKALGFADIPVLNEVAAGFDEVSDGNSMFEFKFMAG